MNLTAEENVSNRTYNHRAHLTRLTRSLQIFPTIGCPHAREGKGDLPMDVD